MTNDVEVVIPQLQADVTDCSVKEQTPSFEVLHLDQAVAWLPDFASMHLVVLEGVGREGSWWLCEPSLSCCQGLLARGKMAGGHKTRQETRSGRKALGV